MEKVTKLKTISFEIDDPDILWQVTKNRWSGELREIVELRAIFFAIENLLKLFQIIYIRIVVYVYQNGLSIYLSDEKIKLFMDM